MRSWRRLNATTMGTDAYWEIALQNSRSHSDLVPVIASYVRGRTLDLGAGQLVWRPVLAQNATGYVSADLAPEHAELDVLLDATAGLPFSSNSFDTVFCCSVLEHTRAPWRVFPEVHRILRPGGVLVLSVPFVFYLHGAPYDYYRFTAEGIHVLAEDAGLCIEHLQPSGGLVDLLLNVPSISLSALLASVGATRVVPELTRLVTAVATQLGRVEPAGLFALNHVAVLRKPHMACPGERAT
jgi:SAM-dependent methyltransferase